MFATFDKWIDRLAIGMAACGGLVLIGIVAATCISIVGRELTALGLGPIPGDFEIVEIGTAFAIFAFLPLCTLRHAHASVDLLAPVMGRVGKRLSDIIVAALMSVLALVITWRLFVGMGEKQTYQETTFILQFPVWIAYALCLIGAVVFVLAALWSLVRSISGASRVRP